MTSRPTLINKHFLPDNVPMIIALTGRAGSGKDTAGNILRERHGFATIAFADPIRDMMRDLLCYTPINTSALYDRDQKESPQAFLGGASVRRCMQTLGTEWGRQQIDGGLWLNIARHRIDAIARTHRHVAITDCRFDNEAALIHEIGGQVWQISRPEAAPVEMHVSEAGIADRLINRHIDNSGCLNNLERQLAAALATVLA